MNDKQMQSEVVVGSTARLGSVDRPFTRAINFILADGRKKPRTWRMLRVGEKVRHGDQYLGGEPKRWRLCLHDLGRRVSRHGQETVPVRRSA